MQTNDKVEKSVKSPYMKRITSNVCLRKDVGINGNLYGGTILSWLDTASYLFAKKHTEEPFLVTMKFGEMIFKKPIHEGDIVDFYCDNIKIGNSSVGFDIEARIDEGVVFSTNAVFVAVDVKGNKKMLEIKISELQERFKAEQLKLALFDNESLVIKKQKLTTVDTKKNFSDLSNEELDKLKESGMLWELYPEANEFYK